jgi:hypothetical protein
VRRVRYFTRETQRTERKLDPLCALCVSVVKFRNSYTIPLL